MCEKLDIPFCGHRLLVGAYLVYAQVVFEDNKDDVVLISRFHAKIIPILIKVYNKKALGE